MAGKLPLCVKLGYGMGQFSEGVAYNFFYFFYTYFLVTVAGIGPGTAGILSAFAVVWDAITDPLCGFLSDRSRSPLGRRRSFIGKAAVPLGLSIALLYWKPPLEGDGLILYFLIVNILFWVFFTACDVPWIILGNEISDDFDEKTHLRSIATGLLYLGQMVSAGLALPAISLFSGWLGGQAQGWALWGLVAGIVTALGFFSAFAATRGRDEPLCTPRDSERFHPGHVVASVRDCLQVKGFPSLFLLGVFATTCTGIFTSGSIFLMTVTYGFSEGQASVFNIATALLAAVLTQLLGWCARKTDKRGVLSAVFLVAGVGLMAIWALPDSVYTFILAAVIYSFADAGFWTLIFAALGDVTELDEYANGLGREGTVSSIVALSTKVGCALGMGLLGVGLELIHYSEPALVVAPQVAAGIRTIFYLPIAGFYLLCLLCTRLYPYSRALYNEIKGRYIGKK